MDLRGLVVTGNGCSQFFNRNTSTYAIVYVQNELWIFSAQSKVPLYKASSRNFDSVPFRGKICIYIYTVYIYMPSWNMISYITTDHQKPTERHSFKILKT